MRAQNKAMQKIKNIAIIAHVDHGKTTLVDKIMYHCQLFRENENKGDLILDNNDLERERGITIVSKNVSVQYKDIKINIIDTPGHADFGGRGGTCLEHGRWGTAFWWMPLRGPCHRPVLCCKKPLVWG